LAAIPKNRERSIGNTTDIVIRTYWRDFPWLELCLRSIEKFASGFRRIIVAVPQESAPYLARYPAISSQATIALTDNYSDDYLGQQVTKLHADILTDADFITHVDSDVILTDALDVRSLFCAGRPIVVTRPFASADRHWPWGRPTSTFLGWAVSCDFMCRPPFTFPRWLYPHVRSFSRATHGVELADYVKRCPPRGFSEFNVLGALAFADFPGAFEWIEQDADGRDPFCRWYWSWEGLDRQTRSDIERSLA